MYLLILALLATGSTLPPGPAEAMPVRVRGFLQYMASVAPGPEEKLKHYRLRRPIDPKILADSVSAKGLSIVDVAGRSPPIRLGLDKLQKELKSERGLTYRYFVGLAIDVAGYTDYSGIPCIGKDGTVRVSLSSYILTFVFEGGLLKLSGIEYTDPEGD